MTDQSDDALLSERGSLLDLLDGVLNKGVLARGCLTISVAEVDLVYIHLQAIISSIEAAARYGLVAESWTAGPR